MKSIKHWFDKCWLTVLIGVVLALSGCASGAQRRYEARTAETKTEYAKLMINPECSPEYLRQHPESPQVYAKCGDPIYGQAKSEWKDYAKTCRSQHVKAARCLENFRAMMIARMQLRYKFADPKELGLKCQAQPKDCENLSKVEWWFADSHNDKVMSAMGAQHSADGIQYLNEAQQERRDNQKIWDDMFKPSSPSVNCTTNQVGNTAYTNCK